MRYSETFREKKTRLEQGLVLSEKEWRVRGNIVMR